MGGSTTNGKRPKIATVGVKARFGSNEVVHGVHMQVAERTVTAIIGPSGCGKSTLLRTLNRMHELVHGAQVEGEVLLDGENVYAHEVDPVLVRRRVGMVFQKPNPFPSMSVRQNVLAGLNLTGRALHADADALVEKALKQAALWEEVKDRLDAPARSDRDGAHRGPYPCPQGALYDRDRDPQHAAGGARLGAHRVHAARRPGRVCRDEQAFYAAHGSANRGLHHRKVWLMTGHT